VHELSHALVGRTQGIGVRTITLFVFGGIAQLEHEPRHWRGELLMALAGPVASLAIGLAMLLAASALAGPIDIDPASPETVFASLGVGATLLLWLGQVNLLLAAFNLVPGFPLDGGRVLRAILWGVTGDLLRATRWATDAGRGFAWMLMGSGVAMALGIRVPLLGMGPVNGLWVMLIGWFLNNAALASYRQALVRETLRDVPVARLMRPLAESVPPQLAVSRFIDEYLMRSDQRAFPVIDGGRLAGLVCLADVRTVPRDRRAATSVGDVMTPASKLSAIGPGDDAAEVLSRLAAADVNQLPVIDGGRLEGVVLREDIIKWLALRGELPPTG
jgi:Zn-dependent protease/CBS domain-containing protein